MIKLSNLSFSYHNERKEKIIFKNVYAFFPTTGFIGLYGESGLGKSTLFKILSGDDLSYSGSLTVNNRELKDLKKEELEEYRLSQVGTIFQEPYLINYLTVYENLELALLKTKLKKKEKRVKIEEALKRVGLLKLMDQGTKDLSGGERSRVNLARSLLLMQPILLADEPTGALDEFSAQELLKLLKDLSHDHLIILITHQKELAATFTEATYEIKDQKLVLKGNLNAKIETEDVKPKIKLGRVSLSFYFRRFFHLMRLNKGRSFLAFFVIGLSLTSLGLSKILKVSMQNSLEKELFSQVSKNQMIVSVPSLALPERISMNKEVAYKMKDEVREITDIIPFFQADFGALMEKSSFYFKNGDKKLLLHDYNLNLASNYHLLKDYPDEEFILKNQGELNDNEIIFGLREEMLAPLYKFYQLNSKEEFFYKLKTTGLPLSLVVEQSAWNYYYDEDILLVNIIITNQPAIIHSSPRYGEFLFEETLHYEGMYEDEYPFTPPWEIKKFQMVRVNKGDEYDFVDHFLTSHFASRYYLEAIPNQFKYELLEESAKYYLIFSDSRPRISFQDIQKILDSYGNKIDSYFFGSEGGYQGIEDAFLSGFSHPFFISKNREPLNEIGDKYYEALISSPMFQGASFDFSSDVLSGGLLETDFEKKVVFEPLKLDEQAKYRFADCREIVISKKLQQSLKISSLPATIEVTSLKKTILENEKLKNIFVDGSLKIIGVNDKELTKNVIYQKPHFIYQYFFLELGFLGADLIPNQCFLNFKDDVEGDKVLKDLQNSFVNYHFSLPGLSLLSSSDAIVSILEMVFEIAGLSLALLSLLILYNILRMSLFENQKEHHLLKLLGNSKGEITLAIIIEGVGYGLLCLISTFITLFSIYLPSITAGESLAFLFQTFLSLGGVALLILLGALTPLIMTTLGKKQKIS